MIFEYRLKNKKIILAASAILLMGGACYLIWLNFLNKPEPISCTQDAKLCPGGSYVGRIGPDCEFALCPGAPQWSAIKQAIANCEVKSVWQTHARTVGAKLKNGEELIAVEPKLDDIINLAIAAEEKCGEILMGTE